jgi:hypothetical protein
MGSVSLTPEGRVLVTTPPDPKTGDEATILDPLDFIHAVTTQIPDPGQHMTRYLGAYANCLRGRHRPDTAAPSQAPTSHGHAEDGEDSFTISRRKSWARLLRKVLEVDPLRCTACGTEMKVVAVITDLRVVDRILAHLQSGRGHDPFEPRAPPAQGAPAA